MSRQFYGKRNSQRERFQYASELPKIAKLNISKLFLMQLKLNGTPKQVSLTNEIRIIYKTTA